MVIKGGHAPHLFCFGLGFAAQALAARLLREGWRVSGTCRDADTQKALAAKGIRAHLFDRGQPLGDPVAALTGVTDILSSVPPDQGGDAVLDHCGTPLAEARGLRWVGYLSTTGVYGDTAGAVVDESAPLNPSSERGRRRVAAEARWLDLRRRYGQPVHVFRLAGIYGPGRSPLDQVRAGRARRIDKPGHLFSRIHVDDIATVVRASMARPRSGSIYNLCDDEPAASGDVIAYACELLNLEPPPAIAFEEAARTMSPMALSFWGDRRRVSNRRIKEDLGAQLAYPNYRAGLDAILAAESQA